MNARELQDSIVQRKEEESSLAFQVLRCSELMRESSENGNGSFLLISGEHFFSEYYSEVKAAVIAGGSQAFDCINDGLEHCIRVTWWDEVLPE